jgi:hypothetical protein
MSEQKKTLENQGLCVLKVPPQGPEQVSEFLGNCQGLAGGGNAGGNIERDLQRLVEVWPTLSHDIRQRCLKLAGLSDFGLVECGP